jgi:uncharacterized integral membrane protein
VEGGDPVNDDTGSAVEEIRKGRGGIVIAAIVAVALIVFVSQNTDDTKVTWLFFDGTAPLWIVIIVAAVAGAVLAEILGVVWRRRRRR